MYIYLNKLPLKETSAFMFTFVYCTRLTIGECVQTPLESADQQDAIDK